MAIPEPSLVIAPADIAAHWRIVLPRHRERLTGGYDCEVYRTGDVVLRFERRHPAAVGWEHTLVAFLHRRVVEVVAPLRAFDGTTFLERRGTIISVWPHLPGRAARRRDEADAVAAARLLARLHLAGAAWDGGQRPGARTIRDQLGLRLDGLRSGPIHGDFYPGNILISRGRVGGLIDWSESCVDWLAYELANGVWEFCNDRRRHDFDRDLAQRFVAAYRAEGGPGEDEPMLELIRCRRRIEISDSYAREQRGEPVDVAYRRHNERSLANLGG